MQRDYLDELHTLTVHPSYTFEDLPRQISDRSLAESIVVPADIRNKVIVSGHIHVSAGADQRSSQTPYGTRVHLASNLSLGEPLYVYESWSASVVEIAS
jgi:hypothetical protein